MNDAAKDEFRAAVDALTRIPWQSGAVWDEAYARVERLYRERPRREPSEARAALTDDEREDLREAIGLLRGEEPYPHIESERVAGRLTMLRDRLTGSGT